MNLAYLDFRFCENMQLWENMYRNNNIFLQDDIKIIFLDFWVTQLHETKENLLERMQFYICKVEIFNTHMKRQHHLALGRHRNTLFGQLYWWNKPRETKEIYMQFYICKIKHI